MRALRIGSVTLRVGDLAAAERLYRWSFRLEPVGPRDGAAVTLGWPGGQDRIHLVGADTEAGRADGFALRMTALPAPEALEAVRARGLTIAEVGSPTGAGVGDTPDASSKGTGEAAAADVTVVAVEAPGGTRVDLLFPSPARGDGGARTRLDDSVRLETPGILGLTWGLPAAAAARAFLAELGAVPMDPASGSDVPLRVGDQQVVIEDRATPAVYGLALVVPAGSLPEVRRTLEHLQVELRAAGTRLLARDPGGRILLVHGVRAG